MSEPRFTDTNSADDTAGRAFGLEGDLYLPVVIALVLAVALFCGLGLLGIHYGIAGAAAVIPIAGAAIWTVGFKHRKPRGYDRDKLDEWQGRRDLVPHAADLTHTKAHDGAPDGRFYHGFILFGSPERGGVAAKGFRLEPPDLRGAAAARLNGFQDQVRALLAMVGPGRRLQFQWSCDPDYRAELLRYHERTQSVEHPEIRRVRNERFTRYWERMLARQLRREHLLVFLSIEVSGYTGNLGTRTGFVSQYDALGRELAAQFEEFAGIMRGVFGNETTVTPLDDAGHYLCLHRFLNPGAASRLPEEPAAGFDPALSLQENCWHCEGIGQPDGGFHLDGHFQAILALSRWPQRTRPGIVNYLTGLPFLDYCLTVNVTPISARTEIGREERSAERLRGEYAGKPRASVLVALRKKERKVEHLSGGFARPFHVTYLIRVWAPTREGLREKVAAVQAAIQAMDGAQYLECSLPTTARKLFFASWPGWTHSSYHHRELYAEDSYLADLLPFSATFTGALGQAEALYDGSHGNLVGVSTETGGSPQHAVLFGMTGAGKSAFTENLLWQTAAHFDYTLIAEEGLSYKRFTEALGETPIIVHPDSALTLNYLDTQRLPLSQLHLATAVALLARMIGEPDRLEQLALRQAQLTQYLHQLYRDTFTDWARRNPPKAEYVRRFACAVHGWRTKQPAGATPLDAFCAFRDRLESRDHEAQAHLAGLSEEAITRFSQMPETERLVAQTACAFYSPEDCPTHSALVELLAYGRFPEHGKEEIDRLATLLRGWSVEGQYGRLFDGVTNVSLHRKVAHFELGCIPEQAVELKAAVGLLISGLGRQHILSLPREKRKRILFEELARFLDTPGGEQIVAEGYAQLRKHNCWCASIIQQYSRFKASRVRGAVIGNAKQFFFMRQSDRADLADLAQDLPLPETAIDAIQRYPLPEQLPANQRHSSLCYFTPTTQPPQCGTVRHYQEAPCASAA
ncbi:MAG TPA: hypothetical protein PLG56_01325 [Lacunisphaera sp.]|nr:hypothetical protein [Lacunisphaera sp.]